MNENKYLLVEELPEEILDKMAEEMICWGSHHKWTREEVYEAWKYDHFDPENEYENVLPSVPYMTPEEEAFIEERSKIHFIPEDYYEALVNCDPRYDDLEDEEEYVYEPCQYDGEFIWDALSNKNK